MHQERQTHYELYYFNSEKKKIDFPQLAKLISCKWTYNESITVDRGESDLYILR